MRWLMGLIRELREHRLARHTLWMMIAQGARLFIQGIYFVVLARSLGATGFGAFTAALALIFVFVPFAGWGTGNVLIARVSRDSHAFPKAWGTALLTILCSGVVMTVLAWVVGQWTRNVIPTRLLLMLALTEFFFGRVVETAGQAYQAVGRVNVTALIQTGLGLVRLLAALGFVCVNAVVTPERWTTWYFGATALAAAATATIVTRDLGIANPGFKDIIADFSTGWHFSFGMASSTIYNDIDKTMLARFATLDSAGIYGAAYRVLTMVFVPIRALNYVAYARYFVHGQNGLRGTVAFAKRLLPFTLAYGAISTLALIVGAPLLPRLLGGEYAELVNAARWLAFVPFIQAGYLAAGDSLTGAGYQAVRSYIQVLVALLNVGLNVWLIPLYSWRGAAAVTLVTELSLAALFWGAVLMLHSRGRDAHA